MSSHHQQNFAFTFGFKVGFRIGFRFLKPGKKERPLLLAIPFRSTDPGRRKSVVFQTKHVLETVSEGGQP